MNHIRDEPLSIVVGSKVLPINSAAIHAVLGIPIGGVKVPSYTLLRNKGLSEVRSICVQKGMKKLFSNRSKVHGNMKSFEGLQKNDVPRWVIESFASSGSNNVWTLQCFMMSVFNALTFPTSVLNINGSDFLYCKEIMCLGEFDWCQDVVDDIRDKVDRWKKNRDKATPLAQGCIAFIMIYYLDNLECEDMIVDLLRERNDGCYANIGGDGQGGQGQVLESGASSAEFLYGKAGGVVKIPMLLKIRGTILLLKTRDLNLMLNIGVPPPTNANTKRSKTKEQSVSKMIEHRYSPHDFLHLQPLLRGLGGYLSDGQQKREFLDALDLHDKDVDAAIIKMNEAHKDIEEAKQKIVFEIKSIFGDLVASSLNTESPRDAHRKRRAESPVGASSPNVKRKSQTPQEVSPAHTDGVDDGPEIVVEDSPQLSAGQSSFEQQEATHAPTDTYVQHEERGTQYMAELMYYMFFHKMNEARGPSLELFELLAPGKRGHNAIEGTQQIIGSSDAMKDGVASCDVEKDDVA
ncbi:hypothetical protein GUJ93_ZPchr0002g22950 [Zizania palustris]|uniref:Uncharacterized protein n=1 Tax=Zizania palustris TaxID=103762 RepID=A0A8J5REL8_ZIZPA|nr:hypothetical protein GUJ93_ZPchr0002g22950 [Zizania palustris]